MPVLMPMDLMALQACRRVDDCRCHLAGLLLIVDVSVMIFVTILKICCSIGIGGKLQKESLKPGLNTWKGISCHLGLTDSLPDGTLVGVSQLAFQV
jgi:hypothetical protein